MIFKIAFNDNYGPEYYSATSPENALRSLGQREEEYPRSPQRVPVEIFSSSHGMQVWPQNPFVEHWVKMEGVLNVAQTASRT